MLNRRIRFSKNNRMEPTPILVYYMVFLTLALFLLYASRSHLVERFTENYMYWNYLPTYSSPTRSPQSGNTEILFGRIEGPKRNYPLDVRCEPIIPKDLSAIPWNASTIEPGDHYRPKCLVDL